MTGIKNMEQAAVLTLKEQVAYQPGQVVSKTLAQNDALSVTLFAFDKGEEISAHDSRGDALALVRELGVPLSDLPDDVQEEVRPGLGFDDEVTLEKWLESVQS